MAIFPEDEIKRKSFHFLILLYIIGYAVLPRAVALYLMGFLVFLAVAIEFCRLKSQTFNNWILSTLGGVHRENEVNKVSGFPWTISGSFLTMLLFQNKTIVIVSLLYLLFGDTAAALFGKKYGKHKVLWGKSLEGFFACFITCFIIGLFFFSFKIALFSALFVAVIELIPWPLNDNFWLPLLTALFLRAVC
jgi:dolichol kinase